MLPQCHLSVCYETGRLPSPKALVTLCLTLVSAAAACQDSSAHCPSLATWYGCDACCFPNGDSIGSACRSTCGRCSPPTAGPHYQTQEQALVALHNATAGSSRWNRADHWLNESISYCFWFGVNCNQAGNVTSVVLMANNLTGSMPAQLSRLAAMILLELNSNSLSGSIPKQLGSLTHLSQLHLSSTKVSGSIPKQLGSLTRLSSLGLSSNTLSGSVPKQLGSLTRLSQLLLDVNRLSGSIPKRLGSLTALAALGLAYLQLSGSVPKELGSLAQLRRLYLGWNRLSASLPKELGSITQLTELAISNNRLSGSIPKELVNSTTLTGLDFMDNCLSGSLPVQLARLTALDYLAASNNKLSGTLPPLPSSIRQLILHRNSLAGALQPFTNFSELGVLAIFGNHFRGRLRLPGIAPLQVLVVHENRLSCPVEYNVSGYDPQLSSHGEQYSSGALLAPGNRFSSEARPPWAIMSGVVFQWSAGIWVDWRIEIFAVALGLIACPVIVASMFGSNWLGFFQFSLEGPMEQYLWLSAKSSAVITLGGLCLMGVYVSGAREFDCGDLWLNTSLAHLNHSPAAELAAAVLVSLGFTAQGVLVANVAIWLRNLRPTPVVHSNQAWWKHAIRWLVWGLGVLLLSVPAFLSTLAKSVPGGENTLGLSQTVLDTFALSVAPTMSAIDSVVIPQMTHLLIGKTNLHHVIGCMLVARLWTSVLVPFATAATLSSDCVGRWIDLWTPCQPKHSFNMAYETAAYTDSASGITVSAASTPITTHADVCAWTTRRLATDGCPRFVIKAIGELLLSKMVFTAFVTPVFFVLLKLPAATRMIQRVRASYQPKVRFDCELVAGYMIFAEVLLLGVSVPAILPLASVALVIKMTTVHLAITRLGLAFEDEDTPRHAWFFVTSLLLGAGLVLWLYVANMSHNPTASMIVAIGVPAGLSVGAVIVVVNAARQKSSAPTGYRDAIVNVLWGRNISSQPDEQGAEPENQDSTEVAPVPCVGTAVELWRNPLQPKVGADPDSIVVV